MTSSNITISASPRAFVLLVLAYTDFSKLACWGTVGQLSRKYLTAMRLPSLSISSMLVTTGHVGSVSMAKSV
eukprot:CAMPEP_0117671510 /NCGR_PEP_ID=MMETSP0804-20121206/13373_1 /TAXON_ID=1074897 /ORGANISM="Tetraselmis astigmatica, Strain CCMP880" /LENGTH=71 /DNA_ID=CAMNT_0005479977 /DNA_START=340 /DNA_END=555 /DNA_ORIENTATION=-